MNLIDVYIWSTSRCFFSSSCKRMRLARSRSFLFSKSISSAWQTNRSESDSVSKYIGNRHSIQNIHYTSIWTSIGFLVNVRIKLRCIGVGRVRKSLIDLQINERYLIDFRSSLVIQQLTLWYRIKFMMITLLTLFAMLSRAASSPVEVFNAFPLALPLLLPLLDILTLILAANE